MSDFLYGPALAEAIRSVLSEDEARAAVAFWGAGSEDWVTGSGTKVIANLRMGGTNPHALRKVNAKLRQCDTLHAKVYIAKDRAIVCSANASINGLALEGAQQVGWIEAGIVVDDVTPLLEWFDELWWRGSSEITGAQWKEAERQWNLRGSSYRPSVASFGDFDPDAPILPVVTWVARDDDWTTNEDAVEAVIGVRGPVAERRVDDGLWIRHPDDGRFIANQWVLVWRKLASGRLSKTAPWFTQLSDVVVKGGFSWADGVPQDVLLASERLYPPPFDPREPGFRAALSEALKDPQFAALLEDDSPDEAWYLPRGTLMRKLWRAVKDIYTKDRKSDR